MIAAVVGLGDHGANQCRSGARSPSLRRDREHAELEFALLRNIREGRAGFGDRQRANDLVAENGNQYPSLLHPSCGVAQALRVRGSVGDESATHVRLHSQLTDGLELSR